MDREPCYLCMATVQALSTRLDVFNDTWTEGEAQFQLDGFPYRLKRWSGRLDAGPLAGYAAAVLDLARQIDNDHTRWTMNGQQVRMWAEINLWGLGVCLSHTYDAIELWKSGRRLSW